MLCTPLSVPLPQAARVGGWDWWSAGCSGVPSGLFALAIGERVAGLSTPVLPSYNLRSVANRSAVSYYIDM